MLRQHPGAYLWRSTYLCWNNREKIVCIWINRRMSPISLSAINCNVQSVALHNRKGQLSHFQFLSLCLKSITVNTIEHLMEFSNILLWQELWWINKRAVVSRSIFLQGMFRILYNTEVNFGRNSFCENNFSIKSQYLLNFSCLHWRI